MKKITRKEFLKLAGVTAGAVTTAGKLAKMFKEIV